MNMAVFTTTAPLPPLSTSTPFSLGPWTEPPLAPDHFRPPSPGALNAITAKASNVRLPTDLFDAGTDARFKDEILSTMADGDGGNGSCTRKRKLSPKAVEEEAAKEKRVGGAKGGRGQKEATNGEGCGNKRRKLGPVAAAESTGKAKAITTTTTTTPRALLAPAPLPAPLTTITFQPDPNWRLTQPIPTLAERSTQSPKQLAPFSPITPTPTPTPSPFYSPSKRKSKSKSTSPSSIEEEKPSTFEVLEKHIKEVFWKKVGWMRRERAEKQMLADAKRAKSELRAQAKMKKAKARSKGKGKGEK